MCAIVLTVVQVYLAAIIGHVPPEIVRCFSAFLDFCYIARRHAITSDALAKMESLLKEFHETQEFFMENDVMSKVAAPRQHALSHYVQGI